MARKPVSVFKRPTTKKGQFRFLLLLITEVYLIPALCTPGWLDRFAPFGE
ncbi:MAG TPA: hypothetical protein PLT87_07135 [Spirochaetales bacterium]|nr:hypothetical protein [Spirochaetales bacterium]